MLLVKEEIAKKTLEESILFMVDILRMYLHSSTLLVCDSPLSFDLALNTSESSASFSVSLSFHTFMPVYACHKLAIGLERDGKL